MIVWSRDVVTPLLSTLMEHQVYGVLAGAGSLLLGYLFSRLADSRSKDFEHLKNVPRYYNMSELKKDLSASPSQGGTVMIEGIVRKDTDALISENAGIEGAARLVTTTNYVRVLRPEKERWDEVSRTTENLKLSVPFKVVDPKGGHVRVESIHQASYFRSLMELVYQDRSIPEQRTIGDYATNITVNEIPNGSLRQEFMLTFGSSMAGYGTARLMKAGLLGSEVVFHPVEVGKSIHTLLSQQEMIVAGHRLLALVLIVGGSTLVVLAGVPLVRRLMASDNESDSS